MLIFFIFFLTSVTSATHQIRYNTAEHNWGGTVASIWQVVVHPQYTPGKLANNIGLIHTLENFPSNIFSNVALRCPDSKVSKEDLQVAGWGWTADLSGLLSPELRQVTLPYAADTCAKYYKDIGITVYGDMFCAGNLQTGGQGICEGDEGGAAVKKVGSVNVITGVASYFDQCGSPRTISLFTDVGTHFNWIKNYIHSTAACVN